jgi:hypothetical protein
MAAQIVSLHDVEQTAGLIVDQGLLVVQDLAEEDFLCLLTAVCNEELC